MDENEGEDVIDEDIVLEIVDLGDTVLVIELVTLRLMTLLDVSVAITVLDND